MTERLGHERHFVEAGHVLFRPREQNRGVYVLTRGLVALRRVAPTGEAMIVRLAFPVRAFGLGAFFGSGQHRCEAIALTDSGYCVLEKPQVQALMAYEPALGEALMKRLAADLAAAEEGMLALRRMAVRERWLRLAERLSVHALAERRAVPGPGVRFELPMTHQDLAQVLGIRPETLSRLLRQTRSEGLVAVDGRHVAIADRVALHAAIEAADPDPGEADA